MTSFNAVSFAPMLTIPPGTKDLSFYQDAFGASIARHWLNDDGSIHVAELSIGDELFHVKEEKSGSAVLSPLTVRATTVTIGLFTNEADKLFNSAIEAGALELSPMTDYDYGYRQGDIKDPFGHHWVLQKSI